MKQTLTQKPPQMSWTTWARKLGLHPTEAARKGVIPTNAAAGHEATQRSGKDEC